MDDWGFEEQPKKNFDTSVGTGKVQWLKIIGSIVVLIGVIGLLVYGFYPKKANVGENKENRSYDLTKDSDNYGYPSNVDVPKDARDTVGLYKGIGQDVSDSDKAKLEALRDAASIHEAGWDVKLLGSRKFIDYTLPVELELSLLDDRSVIAKLINNAKTIYLKDKVPDGSYILINPLDEKQMYWKKEIYELLGSKKYVDGLALVYVTDTRQHNLLANHLLFAAGYGKDIDDMYPIAKRVKEVKDYPMLLTVRDNKVVAKKTRIDDFKDALAGWK